MRASFACIIARPNNAPCRTASRPAPTSCVREANREHTRPTSAIVTNDGDPLPAPWSAARARTPAWLMDESGIICFRTTKGRHGGHATEHSRTILLAGRSQLYWSRLLLGVAVYNVLHIGSSAPIDRSNHERSVELGRMGPCAHAHHLRPARSTTPAVRAQTFFHRPLIARNSGRDPADPPGIAAFGNGLARGGRACHHRRPRHRRDDRLACAGMERPVQPTRSALLALRDYRFVPAGRPHLLPRAAHVFADRHRHDCADARLLGHSAVRRKPRCAREWNGRRASR